MTLLFTFADDTVVYCAKKDPNQFDRNLNEDLAFIAQYFYENDLIINLKKREKQNLCCLELVNVCRKLITFLAMTASNASPTQGVQADL